MLIIIKIITSIILNMINNYYKWLLELNKTVESQLNNGYQMKILKLKLFLNLQMTNSQEWTCHAIFFNVIEVIFF